jgi:hypothetical protein
VDPESAFQNPDDYLHTFSAEEGVGYKLMAAIYDAKVSPYVPSNRDNELIAPQSFALQPHLLARQHQRQSHVVRKPMTTSHGPLVSLVDIKKNKEEKTGFTGKGLLRL